MPVMYTRMFYSPFSLLVFIWSPLIAENQAPKDSGEHSVPLHADMPSLWKERAKLLQEMEPFIQRAVSDPNLKHLNDELRKLRTSIEEKTQELLNNQVGYAVTRDKLTKVEERLGIRPTEENKAALPTPQVLIDSPGVPAERTISEDSSITPEAANGF